jgi:nitrate/nitrite-specific signal transduction histidine kinase
MRLGIRWGSLRTKIIAWSFVPTAIILVAVALVTYTAYQQVTEDLVLERNRELTRLSASQLAAELTEYSDLLTAETHSAAVRHGYPAIQQFGLEQASNRLSFFDGGMLILDTLGTVVAAEPARPEIIGRDWSDRPYFRQMLSTPGSVFSDVLVDGPEGTEVMVIAVPILGDQGELVGLLGGMFRVGATSISAFYGDVVKLRLKMNGDAYLVDGSGLVIYHSVPQRVGEDFSDQEIVQQVLDGQLDSRRTINAEGEDIVASFAPVPGTNWGLVTQESWSALISASQGHRRFLLLLLLLGIVVPALVVSIGVRRLTRPVTELISAAQQVASGRFGQTITARTGDEIQELAEQFNLMSAQLQETYTQLEKRVADRTKELETLNAIAAMASQSLDLDEILNNALQQTLQVMDIDAGGIYLLDEETMILNIVAQHGFSPMLVAEIDALEVGEGFSGQVVQTGQPLVVNDVSADSRLTREVVKQEGLRSLAIVPLSSKGKTLGTLFTSAHGYREFTDQDVQLLTSIGHQIGVAVENARLFQALQRRAEQFRVIAQVGHRITSILDIDQVLIQVVRLIQQAFDYDHVGIALVEGDDVVYKVGAGALWDNPEFRFEPERLKIGEEGIAGWVAATGEPLLIPDVCQEPRYVPMHGSRTRSELTVPLKTKTAVIGVLDVQSDRPNAFDTSDLTLLQSLASQAAIALENARLYEQAQQLAALEERSRLARDLHDAVTQTLFSASLIAEALPSLWEIDQEEGRQLLKELRQLSRGALAEMRTLLLELRPAALAEASLEDLLRQLGEAVTGQTGVPVRLVMDGPCHLPSEVHVALYRIAQEALNNVVKHADATQIQLDLLCATTPAGIDRGPRKRVELRVCDDGRGFDPSSVSSDRLGLGIIRERAQAIGATPQIKSQPGCGTQLVVVWKEDE